VAIGRNSGAEIVDESPNGIAALAGLHRGDVINAVDGKLVRTPMELAAELSDRQAGEKVETGVFASWDLADRDRGAAGGPMRANPNRAFRLYHASEKGDIMHHPRMTLAWSVLLAAFKAFGQKTYTASEERDHIGEQAIVCATA
jgi:PDZ domain